MRRTAQLCALFLTLLCAGASPAGATIIWQPNYLAADPIAAGWGFEEEVAPDRIRLEGNNLRVEQRPDDVYTSPNGYQAHRAEVRPPLPTKSTPATSTQWKLCERCERWIRERVYTPPGFPLSTDGLDWLVATQIKGLVGGSPPEAIEIKRSYWQWVNQGSRYDLWPVQTGTTVQFDVGLYLSPDPALGWFEVWVVPPDGVRRLVVPRTHGSTQDRYWDATPAPGAYVTDQTYLKNGIYQAASRAQLGTAILYIGAPLITDARPF